MGGASFLSGRCPMEGASVSVRGGGGGVVGCSFKSKEITLKK